MNKRHFALAFLAVLLLFSVLSGCSHSTPTNPVQFFFVYVSPDGRDPAVFPTPPISPVPFPTEVPVASPGEWIGIYILPNNLDSVNFGKLTLVNKNTGETKELLSGIAKTGNTPIVLGDIITALKAPAQPGVYELDLYYNNSVVASASFQVVTQ